MFLVLKGGPSEWRRGFESHSWYHVSKLLFTRLTVRSELTHNSKYIIYMSGRETETAAERNLHIVTGIYLNNYSPQCR